MTIIVAIALVICVAVLSNDIQKLASRVSKLESSARQEVSAEPSQEAE